LLRRAIKEGWPVPAERRPGILDEVCSLFASKDARLTIAAVRVFLDADRVNLTIEKTELEALVTPAGAPRAGQARGR
jgi:hypothetical protein